MKSKSDTLLNEEVINQELESKKTNAAKLGYLRTKTRKCLLELEELEDYFPRNSKTPNNRSKENRVNRILLMLVYITRKTEEIKNDNSPKLKWLSSRNKLLRLSMLLERNKYIRKNKFRDFAKLFYVADFKNKPSITPLTIHWNGYTFSLIYLIYLLRNKNLIEQNHIWKVVSKSFRTKQGNRISKDRCYDYHNRIKGQKYKDIKKIITKKPSDSFILETIIDDITK